MVVIGNVKQLDALLIVLWLEGRGQDRHNWLSTDFGHTDYSFRENMVHKEQELEEEAKFLSTRGVSKQPR